MEFEFNPLKSSTNKLKHGIDFIDAQALWDDVDHVEIAAHTQGEPRWLVIGRIAQVHYAAVMTYRGENIRLISVRRARKEEVQIYEDPRF